MYDFNMCGGSIISEEYSSTMTTKSNTEMRYKVDVMTSSKREAAGIGDGASQLKLTQQKQQNTGCQKSSDVPQWATQSK